MEDKEKGEGDNNTNEEEEAATGGRGLRYNNGKKKREVEKGERDAFSSRLHADEGTILG